MSSVRAFSLRVHEKAKLSINELDDRMKLKLVNIVNGQTSEKDYYKIKEGISTEEAMKIDAIIYFMHNEIGLNLWGYPLKRQLY